MVKFIYLIITIESFEVESHFIPIDGIIRVLMNIVHGMTGRMKFSDRSDRTYELSKVFHFLMQ